LHAARQALVLAPQADDGAVVPDPCAIGLTERRHAAQPSPTPDLLAASTRRLRTLGQLAVGIVHDFNNLMAMVQGNTELILRHTDNQAAIQRLAHMILEATDRGRSITQRLLGFVRNQPSGAAPVDPAPLLEALRELATHTLGHRIAARVDARAGLPPLLADRSELETVLFNLAANARDAMPASGTLTFAAGTEAVPAGAAHQAGLKPGHYIRISVADTGTGVDPAVLGRILAPYLTTKRPGQGTGLGLPMAKAFADRSGGGLAIDTCPGEGTTVSLWLPVAQPIEAAGQKRILVVENDPLVSETLAAVLEDAGFAVTIAPSGAEALAALRCGDQLDALVTDMSVTGIGGLGIIEEAHRGRPGLPAILLTACPSHDAELAVRGALTGTYTLLRKPVTIAHLVGRIEALLAAAAAG
jgi:CheY-like chemotaxis protein